MPSLVSKLHVNHHVQCRPLTLKSYNQSPGLQAVGKDAEQSDGNFAIERGAPLAVEMKKKVKENVQNTLRQVCI